MNGDDQRELEDSATVAGISTREAAKAGGLEILDENSKCTVQMRGVCGGRLPLAHRVPSIKRGLMSDAIIGLRTIWGKL